MQNFSIVISTLSGSSIPFSGQLVGGKITYDRMASADHADESQIASVTISTPGKEDLLVSGNAWEELAANGLQERFLCLSLLDPISAGVILRMAETGVGFRTIVSCDASISCCVLSAAVDEGEIIRAAIEHGSFELDDGNYRSEGDYYCNDSTEPIGLEAALALMLERANQALEAQRAANAVQFVQRVAGLLKFGEPDEDGEPFDPSDGVDDSHCCLMDLIDEARELAV